MGGIISSRAAVAAAAATDVGGATVGTAAGRRLYKLLVGTPDRAYHILQSVQTAPLWPNATSHLVPLAHSRLCSREPASGCLYRIDLDPTEQTTVAATEPEVFRALLAEMDAQQATVYSPDRGSTDPRACACAEKKYGGWCAGDEICMATSCWLIGCHLPVVSVWGGGGVSHEAPLLLLRWGPFVNVTCEP